MKQPKIIGIYFDDNDYSSTITAFLKCILDSGLDKYDLSKENIVKLFNRSAPGLYWLFQNRLRYEDSASDTGFDITKYLKITVNNVFLDDEVSEKLKTSNVWANGIFHVLDAKIFRPYIYSV